MPLRCRIEKYSVRRPLWVDPKGSGGWRAPQTGAVLPEGRFGHRSCGLTISPYDAVMDETLPPCPECSGTYTYELGALLACPECAHEWSAAGTPEDGGADGVIRDAVGNELADGDTVTVIKSLKVKGSATGIKAGTKVRNIRLVDGVDGHDIDCKIDGFGPMQLKSSVVRKA